MLAERAEQGGDGVRELWNGVVVDGESRLDFGRGQVWWQWQQPNPNLLPGPEPAVQGHIDLHQQFHLDPLHATEVYAGLCASARIGMGCLSMVKQHDFYQ